MRAMKAFIKRWNLVPVLTMALGFLLSEAFGDIYQGLKKGDQRLEYFYLFLVLVLLSLLLFLYFTLALQYRRIEERSGITVSYFGRTDSGELYRNAREVIEDAEERLITVNSYLPQVADEGAGGSVKFYKLIEKRVREGLRYERIIQVEHPPDAKSVTPEQVRSVIRTDSLRDHLLRCMDMGRSNVDLHLVEAAIPSTFVIVDTKTLIWQVNDRDDPSPSNPGIRMSGVFIIRDPYRQIIPRFEEFAGELKGWYTHKNGTGHGEKRPKKMLGHLDESHFPDL